jgi:hypothetical protein
MMVALLSRETSVLTRATRPTISEDGILHVLTTLPIRVDIVSVYEEANQDTMDKATAHQQ